jgi:hypothetical protein
VSTQGRAARFGSSSCRRPNELEEKIDMGAMILLAFIVLVGPLAYFFGVDSRVVDERGWWPAGRAS